MGYILLLLLVTGFVHTAERVGKAVDEYTVIYSTSDIEKVFVCLTCQAASKQLKAVTDFVDHITNNPLEAQDVYKIIKNAQQDYQVFVYKTFKGKKDLFDQMGMRAIDCCKIQSELFERLLLPNKVRACTLHAAKKAALKK